VGPALANDSSLGDGETEALVRRALQVLTRK